MDQIDPGGARDADRVDARIDPEPPVLHRDRGLGQIGGHVGEPERVPHHVAEGGEGAPGAVHQREAGPPLRIERRLRPRQVAREPDEHAAQPEHGPDRQDEEPARDPPAPAPLRRGLGLRMTGGGLRDHKATGPGHAPRPPAPRLDAAAASPDHAAAPP